jgi:hypothetical protein
MMVECRCEVLNNMSGDVARDYVRHHLDQTRSDGQGRTYLRCPVSGVGWVEERAPSAYGDDTRRLRRLDRA